ncbi:MAG: DMT family transporter [Clostridia bacterium]|nr:DMT family transporter [Clostridia bacterium]
MLGIVIAIISAIFMAAMQILLKKSYKELDPSVAFFFDAMFGILIWIPVGFIFGATINGVINCLLYAIISAVLSEALVFYALSKGDLSVSTVMIATYPIYTLLFSRYINNEILSVAQLIFIVLTILGTILTCFDKDFKISNFKKLSMLIPILSAVAIGLSDTLTKKVINETSSFNFLVAIAIVQIPVALIYLKIAKQKFSNIFKELKSGMKEYKYSIIGSLLNVLGTGCLLVSFNYGMVSIVSPLTAIYTPFVLIYSIVFLKEKINKLNLVGIITALIGTFGIIMIG